ncbi:MAG: Fe-S cluster assembly protein HesB [Actinobacteria bacterium]|nr:Fe-S cluster assembly protein HesB [Actinomycetota bacterium]MCA1720953.1 Fe-S cluster assembly protein HesB [Actinomycetota bacterium]
MATISITGDAPSDALLSEDPLALLLGMLLDQQIPMEKAFRGPYVLQERLGRLDARTVAAAEDLPALFAQTPAIHRFPGSMATRVQELCRELVETYDGDAAAVWTGVKSGKELLARLEALPGFGTQKAQIFLALLGKQLGVRPRGWREAAGAYGDDKALRSVADVRSPETLLQVRAYKQQVKAAAKAAKG